MEGYLPVPKWIIQNASSAEWLGAWLDIVRRAAWEDGKTYRHGVVLKKGEVLITITAIAERWEWSRRKAQLFLERLVKEGSLTRREGWNPRDRRGTVYLVAEYDTYTTAHHDKRYRDVTPTKKESSKHPNNPTPPPEEFGAFRAAYPANGRTNWKQAETRYAKVVATVSAGVLLAKATEYAGSRDARDPQYVMGAQVWLHTKRGWEIEYETTNGSSSTGAKLSEAGQFYD